MFMPPFETQELARTLADPTRFEVFSRIAAAGRPVTVKELMTHFDLHHSAIRIHLRKLEEAGLITSEVVHHPGAVCRPEISFSLGPRRIHIAIPPNNPELLADLALQFATEHGANEAALRAFGEKWGKRWAEEKDSAVRLPLPQALVALKEALIAMGCSTEVGETENGGSFLIETNCLFSPLSRTHLPLVCELHQGIIAGMLSALSDAEFQLEHQESMAKEDHRCITLLIPTSSSPTPETAAE